MSHQFNDRTGPRGNTTVTISMADLYDIVRDRIEYMCVNKTSIDPDAVCQNVCVEVEKKMGIFPNVAVIGLIAADPTVSWPKRGEAEKQLCTRQGWEFRLIHSIKRGQPVLIKAMCRGELAVNRMIEDEGFAISLVSSGWRISYAGSVFARCADAMRAAEEMMSKHQDWTAVQSQGFDDRHRQILKEIIEAAEKRGEIMLDRVYPY